MKCFNTIIYTVLGALFMWTELPTDVLINSMIMGVVGILYFVLLL